MQHLTSMEGFRAPYESPATRIIVVSLNTPILNYSGAGGDGDILDPINL